MHIQHAPGPWTAEIRRDGKSYEYVVHLDNESRTFDSWGWGSLTRIIVYGSGLGQNQLNPGTRAEHAVAKSNLHLMAAAPDLLAACKAIKESCPTDSDVTIAFQRAWDVLLLAIEKAERP